MNKKEPRNAAGGLALPFPKPYEPQFSEEQGYRQGHGFYDVYTGPWVDWAREARSQKKYWPEYK